MKHGTWARFIIFIFCLAYYSQCYSKQGTLYILAGPSGVGKTTLGQHLKRELTDLEFVVTYTTRKKRDGEIEGKDYYFVNKKEFNKMLKKGYFLTHTTIHGNLYGLPLHKIEKSLKKNKILLLSVNWQGNQIVKERLGDKVVSIFIQPPGLLELERRINKRGQNTKTEVEERMKVAVEEMTHAKEYDYIIQNDNFDKTLNKVKSIIMKHSKKRS